MKLTSKIKTKIQYMITITTEVMKLTLQTLVALPAIHYAYMGFNSMDWITYAGTDSALYKISAYLLALILMELVVIALSIAALTLIARAAKGARYVPRVSDEGPSPDWKEGK